MVGGCAVALSVPSGDAVSVSVGWLKLDEYSLGRVVKRWENMVQVESRMLGYEEGNFRVGSWNIEGDGGLLRMEWKVGRWLVYGGRICVPGGISGLGVVEIRDGKLVYRNGFEVGEVQMVGWLRYVRQVVSIVDLVEFVLGT